MNIPEGWLTREVVLCGWRVFWENLRNPTEIKAMEKAFKAMLEAAPTPPEVECLRKDAEMLDWLADPENTIGNVQLPTDCVQNNLHSLRDAISAAMTIKNPPKRVFYH